MKYGYARVSTKKQTLDRQLDSLNEYGVEKIFTDKQSGKNFDRPGYIELKKTVCDGDEIYVHALDRLGRNKDEIIEEMKWFKKHKIAVRCLDMPTTLIEIDGQDWIMDMINNVIIEVVTTIAQQERERTVSRIKEGLEATKKRGTKLGRKPVDSLKIENAKKLVNEGMSVSQACIEQGISRGLYYKYL